MSSHHRHHHHPPRPPSSPGSASSSAAAMPGYKAILSHSLRSFRQGCMMNCVKPVHPFLEAVQMGQVDEVARMLRTQPGLMREALQRSKRTAWHIAAQLGHIDILRLLAATICGPNLIRLSSSLRRLIAMPSSVKDLLKQYVNRSSRHGATALMLAAYGGHAECVKFLLSLGADPWAPDTSLGMTALHHAAKVGRVAVICELLEDPPHATPAGMRRNPHQPRYVDALDAVGFTALHYATWACKQDAMQILFSHGAKLVARSVQLHPDWPSLPPGVTPLHIASMRGDLDLVKLILRTHFESFSDLIPSAVTTPERNQRARVRPDPRLILTRHSKLPYHLAMRAGHTLLLEWLDPSLPLMFLFNTGETVASESSEHCVGVPRLAIIAANHLHDHLVRQLVIAGTELDQYAKDAATTAAAALLSDKEALLHGKQHPQQQPRSSNERIPVGDSGGLIATAMMGRRSRQSSVLGMQPATNAARRRLTDDGLNQSLLRRLTTSVSRNGGIDRRQWDHATSFMRMGLSIPEDPNAEVAEFDPMASLPLNRSGLIHTSMASMTASLATSLATRLTPDSLPPLQEAGEPDRTSAQRTSDIAAGRPTMRLPPLVISVSSSAVTTNPTYQRSQQPSEFDANTSNPDGGGALLEPMELQQQTPRTSGTSPLGGTFVGTMDSGEGAGGGGAGGATTPSSGGDSVDGGGGDAASSGAGGTGQAFFQPAKLPGTIERSASSQASVGGGPAGDVTPLEAAAGGRPSGVGADVMGDSPGLNDPLPVPAKTRFHLESLAAHQDHPSGHPFSRSSLRSSKHFAALEAAATAVATGSAGSSNRPDEVPETGVAWGGGPAGGGSSGSALLHRSFSVDSMEDMLRGLPQTQASLRRQVLLGENDLSPNHAGVRRSQSIGDVGGPEAGTDGGVTAPRAPAAAAAPERRRLSALLQGLRNSFVKSSNVVKPNEDTGEQTAKAAAPAAVPPPVAEEEEEEEEDVCPVCLDNAPNIMAHKCGHRLCVECARDLCQRHYLTPALCPYCRAVIGNFTACTPNTPHMWTG